MPKLFLSYARDSAPAIQTLIGHLDQLGNAIWVDRRLRGGQHWWDEILREIAECDVFIAAVSRTALRSVACARERAWAELLGKHILPVAVERLPRDLPGEFAGTQIIDYSTPEVEAVLALAASLTSLPPPRPLPDPLPPAPPAPLSHMTELTDKASSSGSLTQHEQREIVTHLEDALRSTDPEERQAGRNILQRLASRGDLYADVYRRLVQLQRDYGSSIPAPPAPQPASGSTLTIDRVAAAQKRSSTSQAFDLLREKHRDYIETLLGKHLVNILHVIGEVLMEPDVTKRRQLASNARKTAVCMTASLVGKNAGKGTRANLFRLNEAKAQMKLEPGAWYGRGDRSYRVFKPGDEIFDATMRNEVTLVESMADDLVKALGNRYRTYVTHPVSIVGGSDQEPFHIYGVLTVDCPRVGDLDSKVDVAMVAVFSTLIAATYEV